MILNKLMLLPLTYLILVGCIPKFEESKLLTTSDNVAYLKEYEARAAEDKNRSIEFEKIGETIYWITTYHGAGTRQEYFWINKKNQLILKYIFEYGGMNWDEPLEYTLISIDHNDTITGMAAENEILLKKIDFIKKRPS